MTDLVDIQVPSDQQEGTESVLAVWTVQIGDYVEQHDPVAELSTDKAVVEVAAPVSGYLREVFIKVDEQVEPGTVLGRMEASEKNDLLTTDVPGRQASQFRPSQSSGPEKVVKVDGSALNTNTSIRMSPAVKRLAAKHKIDISKVVGTGHGGRITRSDLEGFMGNEATHSPSIIRATFASRLHYDTSSIPSRRVPHHAIRKKIARHMVESLVHTAPHVTAVFDCDMTKVLEHRQRMKPEFEAIGIKLTLTSYFVVACVKALQAVPEVNSRFHDDELEIFEDYNIGIGTALEDKGLVAPVLHQAQHLDFQAIAAKLGELTEKARNGSLIPADLANGTFTISNHGVSGSLVASPIIIHQPQSAILGLGKLEKRPVVIENAGQEEIQIRPRLYVTLTIDHRALDAYHTNRFLTKFVETIENWH